MARTARPLEERFAEKVEVRPQGCWPFVGKPGPRGYVRFRVGDRAEYAHRVAYKLHHGVELDEDDEVRQTCGNRACCRPHHLRRFRDGNEVDASGQPIVRRSGATVIEPWRTARDLSDEEVREIRSRYVPAGTSGNGRLLAAEYGISYENLQNIVKFRARAKAGGQLKTSRQPGLDDAIAQRLLDELVVLPNGKAAYGQHAKLAEKYGIPRSMVHNLQRGTARKHLRRHWKDN